MAEAVGKKLSKLARYHQIICITHLPQIAKFGDNHFRITKNVSQGRTITSINPLNEKDRIKEIARMLGGMEITKTTLDHAREMLQSYHGMTRAYLIGRLDPPDAKEPDDKGGEK